MKVNQQEFNAFISEKKEPTWFSSYRKSAFKKLKSAKMPSFKYGLNILIEPTGFSFDALKPLSEPKSNIKIENPEKSVSVSLGNALTDADPIIDEDLKDFTASHWQDNNQLYYFNQAFANDFLIIKIPDNLELKKPIQIRYDIKQSPFISNIFILAGKNAKAQILINKVSSNVPSKVSSNKASYVADDVRIISGPNSKIEFITIQNLSKKTINVQRRNALTKKNAEVNWIDICLGTKYTKSDVITSLVDEGATAKNTVLFLGSQEQQYDLYTASLHKSPNTFSDIVTKGVLNDKSKALSRGLVRIEKNAAGSNGYETQDVLILSEKAEADAIPNLEIENNDVKCSHGSTVGQIDKDKLFYLMSRGLAESEAKMKIVEGYFTPVLDLFKDPDLKDKVHNSITKAMG